MADISDNIGLEKPFGSENHSLDMINRNYDRIDKSLGKLGAGEKPFDSKTIAFLSSSNAFQVEGNGVSFIHRIGNWAFWKIQGEFKEKVGPSDTGNIANTLLCTINSDYRPVEAVPLSTLHLGPNVSAYIAENGNVDLTAIAPNFTFNQGDTLALGGWGVII